MKRNKNDSKVEEFEIEKIQSEIARNKEERLKIEFERKELERNALLPWYKKKLFIQAIVAGIVFVPLAWFYAEKALIPMIQADNIRLTLENESKSVALNNQEKEFQERIIAFRKEMGEQIK